MKQVHQNGLKQSNGIGIAGFILALISFLLGWLIIFGPIIWIFGWLIWGLGFVFSFIGVFKSPRGFSIAGLFLSLFWPIVFFVGTMMIISFFTNDGRKDLSNDEIPAVFAFNDNLATKWDETIQLEIIVNNDDIAKLELIYNDSIFKTWNNPKGKIIFPFKAGYYGLGTRDIQLLSTMKDGSTFVDNRMVRVLSDIVPEIWIAEIVSSFPHSTTSFTQGLEFNDGVLYEGTGQKGQSMVAQVNLATGETIKKMGLDGTYFGEGITILGDKIYQLTWQEQKCFVYNKSTLQIEKDMPYIGEGWGLCNDGTSLIMSNGSERITFRNPETFEIERTIEVYTHQGAVTNLNELEYIDGLIYANVWMTNKVAIINPLNGKVLAEMDATALVNLGKGNGDVLNGIAYDPKSKKLYMTGKNWMKLFEVKIKKPTV